MTIEPNETPAADRDAPPVQPPPAQPADAQQPADAPSAGAAEARDSGAGAQDTDGRSAPVSEATGAPKTRSAGFGRRGIKIGSMRNSDPGCLPGGATSNDAARLRPALRPIGPEPVGNQAAADRNRGPLTPAESKPAENQSANQPPSGAAPDAGPGPDAAAEISPASSFPPPRREPVQFPSDVQAEIDEALAGMSLDEMIGDAEEASRDLPLDEKLRGRVMRLHHENVLIELDGRHQAVASLKQFDVPPEVGTQLDVVITRYVPDEGLYEVSVPGASVDVSDWSQLEEGMVVDATVTGHNTGGLECEVSRIRGFIPASQVALYHVDDMSQFVGEKFACVVTEANEDRRNLVLSRRAVLEREKAESREKLLRELAPGQVREGTVQKLMHFGAFVDLGGVDGLVHISQLGWDRVEHPSEVLTQGQRIKVKVEKVDVQSGKISLAYRDLFENPWVHAARNYPVKSTVSGKVSKIMDFGAFVKLEPGIEGLIHISELSHKRVFRVSEVLTEGQDVEVLVLSVDPESQRMSLSLKALQAAGSAAAIETAGSDAESEEDDESVPAPAKRTAPLKGGLGRGTGGDAFGLKW